MCLNEVNKVEHLSFTKWLCELSPLYSVKSLLAGWERRFKICILVRIYIAYIYTFCHFSCAYWVKHHKLKCHRGKSDVITTNCPFFDSFSYSKTINLSRNKTLCTLLFQVYPPSWSSITTYCTLSNIFCFTLWNFLHTLLQVFKRIYCSNFFLCLNLGNHKEEVYNKSLCVGIAAKTKLTDGFNGDSDWWNKHTPRDGALHLLPLKTVFRFLQPFFYWL